MRCMKKKSLLALCISAAVVFAFPNVVHAETINGYTRLYISSYYGNPPADWKESGTFLDKAGEFYWFGEYDSETDTQSIAKVQVQNIAIWIQRRISYRHV